MRECGQLAHGAGCVSAVQRVCAESALLHFYSHMYSGSSVATSGHHFDSVSCCWRACFCAQGAHAYPNSAGAAVPKLVMLTAIANSCTGLCRSIVPVPLLRLRRERVCPTHIVY